MLSNFVDRSHLSPSATRNAFISPAPFTSSLFGLDIFYWTDRVWTDFRCSDLVDMISTSKPSYHFLTHIWRWYNPYKFMIEYITLTSPSLTPLGITVSLSLPWSIIRVTPSRHCLSRASRDTSKQNPACKVITLREIPRQPKRSGVLMSYAQINLLYICQGFHRLYWHKRFPEGDDCNL